MADTSCASANWHMLEYTGHTCNVYTYSDQYDAIKGIPVATCATVVSGDNGLDFLLISCEKLFFGKDMEHSLLNQNQIRAHIRHHGGTVQDGFTKDRDFGINTKDAFIPFYMVGFAISFDSRIPSNHELEMLPQVVITSKEPWDPDPLRIARVRLNAALLKPKIQHETDHILRSVSNILDEHELCQRAISSVRITEPGSEPGPERNEPGPARASYSHVPAPAPTCERGPATASYTHEPGPGPAPTYEPRPAPGHTNRPHVSALHPTKRHSDVTPENLSRIWNIGLETAQRTLKTSKKHF